MKKLFLVCFLLLIGSCTVVITTNSVNKLDVSKKKSTETTVKEPDADQQ